MTIQLRIEKAGEHAAKVKFCKQIWDDAELIYDDEIYAFKYMPPYLKQPDPACVIIQYRIKIAYDEYFYRKGLVRTPLSSMDWTSLSLNVDVVPSAVWQEVFGIIRLEQP
jgi:hypothetical protein